MLNDFGGAAAAGGCKSIRDTSPLGASQDRVAHLLGQLSEINARLIDRLQPVLTPDYPETEKRGNGGVAPAPPPRSVVVCRSENYADQIEIEIQRISHLIGRIEA